MEKIENLEQVESSYEETQETEVEKSRIEEPTNSYNQKQEAVSTAIGIAKKYALITAPVRNIGLGGAMKKAYTGAGAQLPPAQQKKFQCAIGCVIGNIDSFEKYLRASGDEFVRNAINTIYIYSKRDERGYLKEPQLITNNIIELLDLQQTFGDNSSKEGILIGARRTIEEFKKSGRTGYADVLENIVGDD